MYGWSNAQEYRIAVIPPVASTLSDTDSGVEVTGAPGSSNQNQNSVAENTLRSWAVITPIPMCASCTSGAPPASAPSGSVTAGSGSYSTSMSSSASSAR